MDPSRALLQRYLTEHSGEAFRELVERHVDLVYQTALRRAGGDAVLAQDVAQAVFTDLAWKAPQLPQSTVLAGWLHRHTGFVAAHMIRAEQRRRQREHHAFMEQAPPSANDDEAALCWRRLAPVLDEALGRLSATDRDALVLRYLEGRALREVGGMLGLSENSARMRVNRALEKLRRVLGRRGVTGTTAVLGAALGLGLAAGRHAPDGLPQALATAALSSAPATATATGITAAAASLPWWGKGLALLGMGTVLLVPMKMLVSTEPHKAVIAATSGGNFQASAAGLAKQDPIPDSPPTAPPPVAPPVSPPPSVVVVNGPPAVVSSPPAAGPVAPAVEAEAVKLKLGVIPAVMQFDPKILTVKPGQKVMLLFQNVNCPLQHNFVLVKPGTLSANGALADKMLADPGALAKSYLPVSPDILANSSKLIGPGQSDLIQFTAPAEPGDYPYLCTFPGHWRLMNGILKIAP